MKPPKEYARDVRHGLAEEFAAGGWPSEYTDRVGVVIDCLVVRAITQAVAEAVAPALVTPSRHTDEEVNALYQSLRKHGAGQIVTLPPDPHSSGHSGEPVGTGREAGLVYDDGEAG